MRQFRNKYGEPFSMADALKKITKPQSTKAFQELTKDWRKVGYYRCNSCGNEDCITFTRDIGFCRECGSPEDYQLIEIIEGNNYE